MKIFISVFVLIVFCVPFNVYPQHNHPVNDNRVSTSLWGNREVKIIIEPLNTLPTSSKIRNEDFIRYDYNLYLQFKDGNKQKLYIKKNNAKYKSNRSPNNRGTSEISIFISKQNQIQGLDAVLESKYYKPSRYYKPSSDDDSLSVIKLVEKIIKDDTSKLSFDYVTSGSLFLEAFPSKNISYPKGTRGTLAPFVYVIHSKLFCKIHKHIGINDIIYSDYSEDGRKARGTQMIVQAGGAQANKTDSVHFHITYVKTKVYDSSVQEPKPRNLSVVKSLFVQKPGANNMPIYSKNMSPFVKLPDSISFVWSVSNPQDNIFNLMDTNKIVHIERKVYEKKFIIENKCVHCDERNSKKSYEIKNHDFQPYPKGLNITLSTLIGKGNSYAAHADRQKNFSHESGTVMGETKLKLMMPWRFLPRDSVYVVIQKPFGFTLHNSDELSIYNSWKIDTILVDFSKKDTCVLHWVHLKPLMVFYLDLSDLRGRQGIIDSLKNKLTKLKKDTIANQFVFYISNLKHPIVFTHWKDVNRALGMIRELNPSPPNMDFDYKELCKYIIPGRRGIWYNFYLSNGTFFSNRNLITKHLIKEFKLYSRSLNEDDLKSIVKRINSLNIEKMKNIIVDIFLHKTIMENDIPLKFKGNDIKYGTW